MVINNKLLDHLSAQAKVNPRLRQNYDLRTSEEDGFQRMLNALEPGTVIQIHRHKKSCESIVIVRGKLMVRCYDDSANITEEILMQVGGDVRVAQVEKNQWHSLECLESGTVLFECKDGKYAPLSQDEVLMLE